MTEYDKYYQWFPMELSPFQKTAIQAIVDGHHSLSCVPTGSGKTLPALFAIDYFTRLGKKVIYTSPIKALSNQKYHEFSQKFPNVSVGILTGDIKTNPTGNVLIMTAEILQNIIVSKTSNLVKYIDLDSVACIIHDEIHMINDEFRGHVWEELIMSCPSTIQMVMLSATLDSPESFVRWIETLPNNKKKVYLETSTIRSVPLKHFGFLTNTTKIIKTTKKDPEILSMLEETCNKFIPLYTTNKKFEDTNYDKIKNVLTMYKKYNHFENTIHVLDRVLKKMVEEEMFPAVCFLLSKKQIETISQQITTELLEFDSKIPYTIQKECEKILRSKFPNYKEFTELSEFFMLTKLLERGIGIHHSGMIPVLRELVEILFEKGCIKLLFATETFSVGLNMPIKTSIFTDIFKFDGNGKRMFLPHEFIQASGRAGRRGLDTQGFVIHLFNLYQTHDKCDFRLLLDGPSQKLSSKFKLSFHLFLSSDNVNSFCGSSMTNFETNNGIKKLDKEELQLVEKIQREKEKQYRTPNDVIEHYQSLFRYKSSKQKKKNLLKQAEIQDDFPSIETDIKLQNELKKMEEQLCLLKNKKEREIQSLDRKLTIMKDFLIQQDFFAKDGTRTILGNIASRIHHVPCLAISKKMNEIAKLDIEDLVSFLGCFIPVHVPDKDQNISCPSNCSFENLIKDIDNLYNDYYSFEMKEGIFSGENYLIQYHFCSLLKEWINVETDGQAILFLNQMKKEKGIFLGEFVKYIMNINNLSKELENVAEYLGNMEFLSRLQQIPEKTIKFIVTNQSLYV